MVAVLAVLLVVAVTWWSRRRRPAWLGLLTFAVFLAPPYLMRATVGLFNYPTHRQLYLPMLGIVMLLAVWLADTRRRRAVLLVLPLLTVYGTLAAIAGTFIFPWADSARGSAEAKRALAGTHPDAPIILIGSYGDCAYTTAFDWPERREWKLVPASRSSLLPEHAGGRSYDQGCRPIRVRDASRPCAAVPHGARLYLAVARHVPVPVALVRQGTQQLDGGRVEIVSRDQTAIRALQFRLERPLNDYVFLFASGCDTMTAVPGTEL